MEKVLKVKIVKCCDSIMSEIPILTVALFWSASYTVQDKSLASKMFGENVKNSIWRQCIQVEANVTLS